MSWSNIENAKSCQIVKSPKYAKSPLAENSIQATAQQAVDPATHSCKMNDFSL